ncbi:hypothetical protein [Sulfuriflexus sp.]|uniref:hypothetical protein n=1 Tax=Sulfuriflexus sp. TaxID=2015443 RepID=UPI0028CEFF98|nr:hypothetical protein [Sulfuriflexus sp.]MDT8403408.1 hypothetical protein [Sulfuriflexus sp.]
MEGISDIKISGIDETRPPRIRKEPYINLFFKLIHQAPKDWCEDFNRLVLKGEYPIKIDPSKGLCIETWVRKPEEIEKALEGLKVAVDSCNNAYIARIQAMANTAADVGDNSEESGEQGNLNRIVAGLNFED